jgi:peptidyl-prolyl cis-trans isomerase SurA
LLGRRIACRLEVDELAMQVVRPIALAARALAIPALIFLTGATGAAIVVRPAAAQQIVVMVNGEPITALDIEQRTHLLQLLARRTLTRQEAIDELVGEKIKLQQAKNLKITIADVEVERAFASIAGQTGRFASDFSGAFKQAGLDANVFKSKLRADLAWRQVLQQTIPGAFYVRDADIVAVLTARGQLQIDKATQYTMRQIVFIVPRGSPPALRSARTREAEALRARFTDCNGGVQFAREYRDVVVKDPIIRISTDLPARLQTLIEQTSDGRLTPPEPTTAGIEVVAVCDRKEISSDLTSQRGVKDQLMAQRVASEEKQLLDQFRRQAIIEYR